MRSSWKFGSVGLFVGYFVACAPVKFDSVPQPSCGSNGVACVQTCTGSSCVQDYSVTRTIGQTPVDILIIDDNSGSMSPDQAKLATAFDGFLQELDTAKLDYRIAVTTTDISSTYSQTPTGVHNVPGPYNGNGALQDGNLIAMSNGNSYISSTDTDRNNLLVSAIQRPETVHCEQSGYKECPSDDERGIYAMNLVLDRTASQFMRPTAGVAVIVLSNEDERGLSDSRSVQSSDDNLLMQMYPLENYDRPSTFTSRFHTQFPGKTLSVHSLIVKPGDTQCLASESSPNQFIRAKAGYSYQTLSNSTGGVVGSICDSNYSISLKSIADNIQSQVVSLPFSCRPDGDHFKVTVNPQPSTQVTWTPDWTNMQLKINQALPPLTSVTLSYSCTKSN